MSNINHYKRSLNFIPYLVIVALLAIIPIAGSDAQMFAPAKQNSENNNQFSQKAPQAQTQTRPMVRKPQPSAGSPKTPDMPRAQNKPNTTISTNPSGRNNTSGFNLKPTGRLEQTAEKEEKPHIFLYMTNFKIERSSKTDVECSMRFFVFSTQKDKKLSSISYQLKWPEMLTTISLDDINPNTPTYIDYVLLGKGCYSMDKVPNIIVNRCRIKGMTQQQCANLISWIK